MKKTLLVSVLLIPLILFTIQTGYAGNPWPPGPDEQLAGPVIDAIVGIAFVQYIDASGNPQVGTDTLFWGTCKKEPIKINVFNPDPPDIVSGMTEEWLHYYPLIPQPGTSFCEKKHVDHRLVIVDVKKFYKSSLGGTTDLIGPHIIAEVTLMFVEPKKVKPGK